MLINFGILYFEITVIEQPFNFKGVKFFFVMLLNQFFNANNQIIFSIFKTIRDGENLDSENVFLSFVICLTRLFLSSSNWISFFF